MRQATSSESIVERLQQAAAALERSTRSPRRTARNAAEDANSSLLNEWESVKRDLAELMSNADISGSAEARALVDRMRNSLADATESVQELAINARRRAQHSAEVVDDYVHEAPWATAGVAALAGLAIGLLLANTGSRR